MHYSEAKGSQSAIMLTVKEVAQRLKLSVSGVYALIAAGKLLAYSVGVHGGSLRVSESDLQNYLNGCRQNNEPLSARRFRPRKLKHIRL